MKGHSTVLARQGRRAPELSLRLRPAVLGWINVGIGLWVFGTPFVGAGSEFLRWSNGVAGALSMIVAILSGRESFWHAWAGGITGVWLLFSSIFYGETAGRPGPGLWNNLVMGSFIALAGLVGAVRARARSR